MDHPAIRYSNALILSDRQVSCLQIVRLRASRRFCQRNSSAKTMVHGVDDDRPIVRTAITHGRDEVVTSRKNNHLRNDMMCVERPAVDRTRKFFVPGLVRGHGARYELLELDGS